MDVGGGSRLPPRLAAIKDPKLLIARSGVAAEDAEGCFSRAIEVAAGQEARSLELRAVMRLTRLRRRRGEQEPGRRALWELLGWFTEGFDTGDLREAEPLLQELA